MKYGIIGGSGLYKFPELRVTEKIRPETPYGEISDEIIIGQFSDNELLFLPRHGRSHQLPPHKVNYRANIWAFKEAGVDGIIAINAVGGIDTGLKPGDIVIPHQLIDYTYGRDHTYSDGTSEAVQHIDFSSPFEHSLRETVLSAVNQLNSPLCHTSGVYGCTQGPRLETAAEIKRLANDGCTVVGMTAMPEAALARELSIPYVAINIVANMAAGLSDELITIEEIFKTVEQGNSQIIDIIRTL